MALAFAEARGSRGLHLSGKHAHSRRNPGRRARTSVGRREDVGAPSRTTSSCHLVALGIGTERQYRSNASAADVHFPGLGVRRIGGETVKLSSRQGPGWKRRSQRGISLLIILALLACMAIMLAVNSNALALLKQELKLIDERQLRKYGQGSRH